MDRHKSIDGEEREWIESRIRALRSRQGRVGPFRGARIQQTIKGLKAQLRALAEQGERP